MIKNTLKQTKFEDKTVKSTLTLVNGLHDFPDFPDRARMREAWKREHMFGLSLFRPSRQSKSPPPGEQDQLNALPQGQQRQSNPHPMPSSPAGLTLMIGALQTTTKRPPSLTLTGARIFKQRLATIRKHCIGSQEPGARSQIPVNKI